MKEILALFALAALSVPGYIVLRSMAVDDGTAWEHVSALFVSTMFTQVFLKFMYDRNR